MNPLSMLGTWNGNVDDGTNPIHVDMQGFWFDTAAKVLTGNFNFQVNGRNINSFSVEAWVRFT